MADAETPQALPRPERPRFFWPGGLSARLLTLTILFVAAGGALALPPALASFERQWLLERVRAAETVYLFADIVRSSVDAPKREQLLRGAGVEWVAVQTKDLGLSLVLQGKRTPQTPYFVDLRGQAPTAWLAAPFQTLFSGPGRSVRVRAEPRFISAQFIEIVAPDAELKRELVNYLWRMVLIVVAWWPPPPAYWSYLSLNLFLVRPMQRITRAMERFRVDPEDDEARVQLSGRRDEIGRAETELARMQARPSGGVELPSSARGAR
jgi:hypothetical protein